MSSLKLQDAKREEGFTLIELLVVVLIIGILAAIAIPVFLSQRERAWESEITSGVRNVALEIEADAVAAGGNYPTIAAADMRAYAEALLGTVAASTTFNYYRVSDTRFALCASDTRLVDPVRTVTYDTSLGGVQGVAEAVCAAP
jgi:type IV pilus assembly protein PilA